MTKVKIVEYCPILDGQTDLADGHRGAARICLPTHKKEQEGKAREGIGAKLSAGDQVNSQTKLYFLWVLSSSRKEKNLRD